MALKSSCILVHRTVTRDGTIILEFAKQITNGEKVLSSEPNLMSVSPLNADGSPVDWVLARKQLDSHMGELGFDPVSDADWEMVTGFSVVVADIPAAVAAIQQADLAAPATLVGADRVSP